MDVKKRINSERRDFELAKLQEVELLDNPFDFFKQWLETAIKNEINEPNAFCLSTVENNKPSSRILYIRDLLENGLVFYTNYNSKKGKHLEQNQNACANFFWPELERQIRIEGTIEKASKDISDAYFASRPRESQIGAWASEQSKPMASRKVLEDLMEALRKDFENKPVPRPEFWGGYILKPTYFEFWQGRKSRLHDRFSYTLNDDQNWDILRMFP